MQWKPVPNDCTVHENLSLNVETTFTYHQLQHWGPSWMLERKREGKTMIINIIYTVRMGVCSEVEGLNFLFVDNFPPCLLSPSGTASNSVSSWGNVASSGSCKRSCSTRAWSKVNVLSFPLSRGSCNRETIDTLSYHTLNKEIKHKKGTAEVLTDPRYIWQE